MSANNNPKRSCRLGHALQGFLPRLVDFGELCNPHHVEDFFEGTEYYHVDIYNRIIDDNPGILGVGRTFQNDLFFYAKYWQSNNTAIEIKSGFPWDDGTLSLLKTIRVELIGEPPTF